MPKAPRFGLVLFLIALLAFSLRELFVLTAIVDFPIRGDARDYFAYAFNLVEHGVYSSAFPPSTPIPDGFRLPGYSALLALGMTAWPQVSANALDGWYAFALQAQVVLGTMTVVLVGRVGRAWLPSAYALVAALLLALWPHHIAATGALLSEVTFGFALMFATWCFVRAWQGRHLAWYAATGAVFGYAYLVNPIVLLFPVLLAAVLACLREPRAGATMLGVFLVPVLAFGLRSATIDDGGAHGSTQRASLNFVQGSWPPYHAAANLFRSGDPVSIAIIEEIDAETRDLQGHPVRGLRRIGARMGDDPLGYARWYAIEKPWLLWDWPIQIGSDDLYVVDVRKSPLERIPALRAIVAGMRAVNPLLSLLCLFGAAGMAMFCWRTRSGVPAAATGLFVVYCTVLHVVLQAEPRYAIPYRGFEVLVVATALAWLIRTLGRVLRRAT